VIGIITIAKPSFDEKEFENIKAVLNSGMLAQGKFVEDFENAFAQYIGVNYAVATNSGTSALHTALAALGIQPDDEVITTDFSFVASASCILMQGAIPVFCDIDPKTYNISPKLIENKISDRTTTILPVHLYGQPCDMDQIMKIAEEYNLFVLEDACQAHGAVYKGKKVGAIGDVGVFSFYPTKNMTTSEGGMITTNDAGIAERVKVFRNQGQSKQYLHESLGYNYRMTNIAAAIGLPQLERLEAGNKKRKENAAFLTKELMKIKGIIPPYVAVQMNHVFHQYTIRIEKEYPVSRSKLTEILKEKGIGFGIHYPRPIHKQPMFEHLGYTDASVNCPVSSEMSEKVLSLPVHPGVSQKDLEYITNTIKNAGG
jgi:perosamine synthetase